MRTLPSRLRALALVITAAAVLVIIVLSSLLSIRKVLVIEPAIVFKG